MSTFGQKLKELREAAGMTQAELAEQAGMHVFGVAKLEQGLREPSWATVRALTHALDVSCEAFNEEEEPEKPDATARRAATGKPTDAQAGTRRPASGKRKTRR